MHWRRTDPVQEVTALLLVEPGAARRLAQVMAGKPQAFRKLAIESGEGWSVIFGAPLIGASGASEVILPRVPGAAPLHEAAAGWWLPAGVVLDAPTHAHDALWQAIAGQAAAAPPIVVAPRFPDEALRTAEADLYPIRYARPPARSRLP